ncbi:MAG: TIGR03905 family TSCPD domain-containing protein [Deltaproteobacteria bacterium]|jgi:uncharacterized protein (TIGR03905 family)|nr:TIGR03905 family TSCPD domain-containing protein [Deltaproteobacteria bacterium]
MQFDYKPKGVCPKHLSFNLKEGILSGVEFEGGCPGNLSAVAVLTEGRPALEVAQILKNVKCGPRKTSCPAELAKAIMSALKEERPLAKVADSLAKDSNSAIKTLDVKAAKISEAKAAKAKATKTPKTSSAKAPKIPEAKAAKAKATKTPKTSSAKASKTPVAKAPKTKS